jgi:hypothetical protein
LLLLLLRCGCVTPWDLECSQFAIGRDLGTLLLLLVLLLVLLL